MLGPDEMQEYEEARAASETTLTPSTFAFTWFSLWLAMLASIATRR